MKDEKCVDNCVGELKNTRYENDTADMCNAACNYPKQYRYNKLTKIDKLNEENAQKLMRCVGCKRIDNCDKLQENCDIL